MQDTQTKEEMTQLLVHKHDLIQKFVPDDVRNWDKLCEPLLFAVQEDPQASPTFPPFVLDVIIGRKLGGGSF